MGGSTKEAGADPSIATATVERDGEIMNDEPMEITIELDPMYANMLDELKKEHGEAIEDNLERHVHQLVSEAYIEHRSG